MVLIVYFYYPESQIVSRNFIKKIIVLSMQFLKLMLIVIAVILGNVTSSATSYYFDSQRGHDKNLGTSVVFPFQSLDKVRTLKLKPGDVIYLVAGSNFTGTLSLKDVRGTADQPITIESYLWGKHPEIRNAIIDAKGHPNGIYLENCRHLVIKDIKISADGGGMVNLEAHSGRMRCGVLVLTTNSGDCENITLDNLEICDIFFESAGFTRGADEVKTANGTQSYGWGIRFINRTEGSVMRNIVVQDCKIKNVAHTGIKFTGRNFNIQDVKVYRNQVTESGGPGIQMSGILRGHIAENFVNKSGSHNDSRKWGRGSGLWTWGSMDVVIERNRFMNANGPADSAGCHIDFNCKNVVVQYNFSANNAGGFCEILGNNHNCAYRYNISVNDGYRIKGVNGAFQEGKTFWLSGYVGKNQQRHGPYNSYFYNNTIFVSEEIVSKIAIAKTAQGILIANNLFCVEGESQAVLGDQYNPDNGSGGAIKNFVFENNLFLKVGSWPKDVLIQPGQSVIGDPGFFKKGGSRLTDYIPANHDLISNKGMVIQHIPSDTIGLTTNLKVDHDILGNKISGKPDLGAIELPITGFRTKNDKK